MLCMTSCIINIVVTLFYFHYNPTTEPSAKWIMLKSVPPCLILVILFSDFSYSNPLSSPFTMAEEESGNKLIRKIKEDPHVYLGFAGCLATAGYGIYNFKNRTISASLFLTRLRVVAQSVFVLTLTVGVSVELYTKHIAPKLFGTKDHNSNNNEVALKK